ncbi:MAG: hydroxyethylthiazole kinase, partial [Desulfobacteraceae bacterium]|nr:hydroxyethylthiazole kinase [Desulfobacteraceae bacterium]
DPVSATATALAYFGLAGEIGAAVSKGPGSFQIALLDALFGMDEKILSNGAKIEV